MARFNVIQVSAVNGATYEHTGGVLTFAADADVTVHWSATESAPEGELAELVAGEATSLAVGAGRIRFDALVDCTISVGRAQ